MRRILAFLEILGYYLRMNTRRATFIHELPDWPKLKWDSRALTESLAAVRHRQGHLLGRMEGLGFASRIEARVATLTSEVVMSSAIEGKRLETDEVRSSIARKLGLEVAGLPRPGREVEGIVAMMVDATRNAEQRLTPSRLFEWHAALFPAGMSGMERIQVGAWRTDARGPMRVVSGPMGKERVHFEPPRAQRLAGEMRQFLEWFNGPLDTDPVLKAGAAHFWFVTIHPFDDGNGRIARAIAEMALSRSDGSPDRFYSMSSSIEAERGAYYLQLESAQRGSLDITSWLAWFLGCLDRAIGDAETLLSSVLDKARLWRWINTKPVSERQRTVINRMTEPTWKGHLNTSKYARLAKCSQDTALRDIRELLDRGVLVRNDGGGRSTSYRLADPGAV